MRKIFTVLIFLALSCCCSPHHQFTSHRSPNYGLAHDVDVFIDKSFGEADKIEIDNALMQWNYALNGLIRFKVISTQVPGDMDINSNVPWLLILKVTSNHKDIPISKAPNHTVGWADRIGGHKIYLPRDRLATQDIFPVVLHEVGHILGANHMEVHGLMYPTYTWEDYQCIDYNTIIQVAQYNGLPETSLNYCIFHEERERK